jgi:GNAT superfamily N-acetyltransferase
MVAAAAAGGLGGARFSPPRPAPRPAPRSRASRVGTSALGPRTTRARDPPGLAFTTDASRVDPVAAAALVRGEDDAALAAKLRSAFDSREGVVVGAFARLPGSPDDVEPPGEADPNASGPPGASGFFARRAPAFKLMGFGRFAAEGDVEGKTLIAFARASTDGSMVAVVDEIVVHPEHRRAGVGGKIVRRLARELHAREIYDIGAPAPPGAAQTFLADCGFGPDQEGARLMALGAEAARRCADADRDPGATLKDGGEALAEALLREMDKADEFENENR